MARPDNHQQRMDAIKNMSFEKAMEALDSVVKTLESGQQGLEDAITDYEYGHALRERCSQLLANAEMRVQKITKNSTSTGEEMLSLEPFEE